MISTEDKLRGIMTQQSIESLLDNCIVPLGQLEKLKKDLPLPSSVRKVGREASEVLVLRKLHNYIKDFLLEKAIELRRGDGYTGPISLLDIAVGKGGDLLKWDKLDIKNVWGVDIDQPSIDEAWRRLKNKRFRYHRNYTFSQQDVTLWNKDYSDSITEWLKGVTNGKGRSFDISSCMFAFNYFFKNESSVKNVLKLVSSKLKPGGIFVGVYLDRDKLVDFLYSTGVKNLGDVFESENLYIKNLWGPTQEPELYGSKYQFQIKDKGDEKIYQVGEEYVMDYDWFKQLASTRPYNLDDVSNEVLNEGAGIDITSRHFEDLYPNILGLEGNKYLLSPEEQQITNFYSFFVFKKRIIPRRTTNK